MVHVVPALKLAESLLDMVVSQLACILVAGPQAGENLTEDMATPDTAVQLDPKHPP